MSGILTRPHAGEATGGTAPLLQIRDLHVTFAGNDEPVHALEGVNLTLMPGQTLAIVGESGSGKSTTAHAIIGLLPGTGRVTAGEILFEGRDLAQIPEEDFDEVRGRLIGFVPQDPMSNLNPVWRIGFQVEETLVANGRAKKGRDARAKAIEVLGNAGLPDAASRLSQYPHQFSGGMRQRVLIGIGLSAQPRLLIADEPTSALDVTVQRRILDHLAELTAGTGTAVLLITHDLGLAAERAEQLVVMYRGKVVESGPSLELLRNPRHPYTQRLVAAAPSLASRRIQSARLGTDETRGGLPPLQDARAGGPARAEHVRAEGLDLAATADSRALAVPAVETTAPAIVVENLSRVFMVRTDGLRREAFTAVDDVSFVIPRGTTMALVGESGSGKSTVARLVLGLDLPTTGRVLVGDADIASLSRRQLKALRRNMQPVFQDPFGSLDPLYNIGATISEPLRTHRVGSAREQHARVRELLDEVALPTSIVDRYPNELSGGQRQRVAIARALALKPEILILDEAVSALDVLVQAQILALLSDLQSHLGLSYLFITHDLAVVRLVADTVSVMQKGRIVEAGTTDEVFSRPQQEYTRELLSAIPGSRIRL